MDTFIVVLLLVTSLSLFFLLPLLFKRSTEKVIIHTESSQFADIQIVDQGGQRGLYFKNTAPQQSCIDRNYPQKLMHRYTQSLLAVLFLNPTPQKILILGLGAGILPNTFQHLFPKATIDIVEIDPAMLNVAKRYFNFKEIPAQFTVTIEDGRSFVKQASQAQCKYDLIILDAFNQDYIPEHLLTKEFLTEIKSVLSPEGVLAANTFSSSRFFIYESATYYDVFGKYYYLIKNNQGNRIILASLKPLPDMNTIRKNAALFFNPFKVFEVDPQNLLSLFNIFEINEQEKGRNVLKDRHPSKS